MVQNLNKQNTGMFPPSNPHPRAAGGTHGGIQGQPRLPNPYSWHQSFHMPQQTAVPHWFTKPTDCVARPRTRGSSIRDG